MSWQDELQKLDAELASGRVSADDYRRRRDVLLAGSTSGTPAGPQDPFPKPVQWQAVPPEPEKTQFMRPATGPQPVQQQPGADATQVVSVGTNGNGGESDHTQVVPGVPRGGGYQQSQYGLPQPQQPAGWPQPPSAGSSAPPWGAGDPSSGFGSPSWMHQGPEVFDSAGSSGKGKKIIGIVIIVLLVVGLGVAGYFFFTGRNGDQAAPPTNETSAPPTKSSEVVVEPPAQKPDPETTEASLFGPLPGTVRPGGGQFDLPRMATQKLLVGKTTEALTEGKMTEATLSTSIDGGNTISLVAMKVTDEDAAKKVVEAYFKDQAALKETKSLGYKGVKVYSDAKKKVFRAAYVLYDKAVIVEVFTSEANPGNAVEDQFKELLKEQLEFAPPTVR